MFYISHQVEQVGGLINDYLKELFKKISYARWRFGEQLL